MKTSAAHYLLRAEPVILTLATIGFFYAEALGLVFLPIIAAVFWARHTIQHHWWTPTPLDPLLALLVVIGIGSPLFAPYHPAWLTLARPLFGILLYWSLVDDIRIRGSLAGILRILIYLSLFLGMLAFVRTDWDSNKARLLLPVINLLPPEKQFAGIWDTLFPLFNSNQIGIILAWLNPLSAGLSLYPASPPWLHRAAVAAFIATTIALFLGQSRFSIMGVLVALFVLSFLLIPRGKKRAAALLGIALFGTLELCVLLQPYVPDEGTPELISARDENSLNGRVIIWRKALTIIRDYPLTGVGIEMFDSQPVRQQYVMEYWGTRTVTFAHDEALQMAADLGLPGLLVWIACHIVAAYMLVYVGRHGDSQAKIIAGTVACALLAHTLAGLGETIPVWHYMAFMFWLLFGIAGGQYALLRAADSPG